MPLSEPRGGLDREQFLVRTLVFSDGADTAINFISAYYDSINNQWLIGGNTSFVGFQPINKNKIVQAAALPSTVITGGNVENIVFSGIDSGVIVRIGNGFARSSDGGATWVDVTPAAAVTYRALETWKGNQLVAGAAGGSFDLFISTDNGLTYASSRNIFSAAAEFLLKDPSDTTFVLGAANQQIAITQDEDLATATFVTHDLNATIGFVGNVDAGDIATGGADIVVGSNNGDIAVSLDAGVTFTLFPRDDNFFRNGAAAFQAINVIRYVPALNGFMLIGTTQAAFIPGNSTLLTMRPVYINAPSTPGFTTARNSQAATDGTNLVIATNSNFQFGTVEP